MSIEFRPSRNDLSPREYFQEYRAAVEAQLRPAEDAVRPVEATELLIAPEPVELAKLPRSARAAAVAAESMGMAVKAAFAHKREPAVLYVSDSAEDAKTSYRAGDVRYPAYLADVWSVAGVLKGKIGFLAVWEGRHAADGKVKNAFDWAKVLDPVGVVISLEADYSPSQAMIDALGEAEAKRLADERAWKYNDGATATVNTAMFLTAGEFTQWLDDWTIMLNPGGKLLTPVRKSVEERAIEADAALLAGGEWSAS